MAGCGLWLWARASERAAQPAVLPELRRPERLEVDRALHVPELPPVEVDGPVVSARLRCGAGDPAQEGVRLRLQDPLAGHDAVALPPEVDIVDAGRDRGRDAAIGLDHGLLGLLHLEEQRLTGRAEEQHDVAARADAAHADDAERVVGGLQLRDQQRDVGPERPQVLGAEVDQLGHREVLDVGHQRRLVDDGP